MGNLKYGTNEPIYERETDSRTQRTDLWLPGAGGGRNGELVFNVQGVSVWKGEKSSGDGW